MLDVEVDLCQELYGISIKNKQLMKTISLIHLVKEHVLDLNL